jgi:hypothetical protein
MGFSNPRHAASFGIRFHGIATNVVEHDSTRKSKNALPMLRRRIKFMFSFFCQTSGEDSDFRTLQTFSLDSMPGVVFAWGKSLDARVSACKFFGRWTLRLM